MVSTSRHCWSVRSIRNYYTVREKVQETFCHSFLFMRRVLEVRVGLRALRCGMAFLYLALFLNRVLLRVGVPDERPRPDIAA